MKLIGIKRLRNMNAFNTSNILLRLGSYQSDFYPKLSEEDKNILISQIKIEERFCVKT